MGKITFGQIVHKLQKNNNFEVGEKIIAALPSCIGGNRLPT